MSWTDDIRCLYCDGRLPLYKKITDGQFCSAAHRKAYWQEHERLAVERLHQTHDSLRAYRPPGATEAILGQTDIELEEAAVEEAGFEAVELDAVEREAPEILGSLSESMAQYPAIDPSEPIEDVGVESAGYLPIPTLPQWLPDRLATAEPELLPWTVRPLCPENPTEIAGPVEVSPPAEAPIPHADKLCPIPYPTPLNSATRGTEEPVPMEMRLEPQFPSDSARLPRLAPTALLHAGLRQLPVDGPVAGAGMDSLRALEIRSQLDVPPFLPTTPPQRPRLRLAAGRRYPMRTGESAVTAAGLESAGFSSPSPAIAMPQHKTKVMAAAAATGRKNHREITRGNTPAKTPGTPLAAQLQIPEPGASGLLPLMPAASTAKSGASPMPPSVPLLPQPLRTEPMRPVSKLEPLDAKPIADLVNAPAPVVAQGVAQRVSAEPSATPVPKVHVWSHAIDFWRNAPRDLKTLVFAIPVLLGLALHPTLPKVRVSAPRAAGGFQRNFERVVSAQLVNVRQTMADRAAVALDEDFRAGLDEWASRGDAATQWSFDATGFVRPGPLALYRPSVGLTDYQVQFLGLIDKKALSWVVRAADFENYYVVKMVVLKPGPLPTIGLTRYAVVNGRADARVDTAVPVDAREDMLYRVRLDVSGDDFVLVVQGQMIDNWTEPRLKRGGVGFFTARGEESRIRWLQVTHQYDMLGRLCAYLAPYNIPSTNGGWQQ